MQNDTIVDEIHAARAQLLDQHGGDLAAYFSFLLQAQNEHPERYVSFVQPAVSVAPSPDRPLAG